MRLAWRSLWRQPLFTIVAVVTLALGIGATTAIFSVVNAVVFRPMKSVQFDGVVTVTSSMPPLRRAMRPGDLEHHQYLHTPDFEAFAAKPPASLEAVTSVFSSESIVRIPNRAERTPAEFVSGDYARVFGLRPEAGRFITGHDDGTREPVVVISERLWRDWFQRRREIIGRASVTVNDRPMTVVGVAPVAFQGLFSRGAVDVWIPQSFRSDVPALAETGPTADAIRGSVYARARAGAPADAVSAGLRSLYGLAATSGEWNGFTLSVKPAQPATFDSIYTYGVSCLLVAALVLGAACANLANLMLVRATRREPEIATRISLGATRLDVFRLFASEIAIIAVLSVAAGFVFAVSLLWTAGLVTGGILNQPSWRDVGSLVASLHLTPDWTAFFFSLTAGAAATGLVGLAVAWHAMRATPARLIASVTANAAGTRRGRLLREALVAVQITAAVLLLMLTGVFLVSLSDTIQTRVFLDTAHVAAARLDLSLHRYTETNGRAFYRELLARAQRLPGVEAAALTDGLPGYAYVSSPLFVMAPENELTHRPNDTHRVGGAYAGVSQGFVRTLGLSVIRGRDVAPSDEDGAPTVALVTRSLADRMWPQADPIGKRLMFGHDGIWRTVVGVLSDPSHRGDDAAHVCAACIVLVPWTQHYDPAMLVLVRAAGPAAEVDPLTSTIRGIDPNLAILEVAPLDDSLLAWVRPTRAVSTLAVTLGLLSLAIAALGVYGVIAFLVSLRTREFGLRLALGATPGRMSWMVVDHAIHLVLVGLLPGVLIAALGSRWLLVRDPRSPLTSSLLTWYVVPPLILVVGVIAGYLPARRAARTDPNRALRDL
jgi:predicted permease